MATVQAATNYAAAAWLQLPPSIDFGNKHEQIDHIVARKALGSLEAMPWESLYQDVNIIDPITRLSGDIALYMVTIET